MDSENFIKIIQGLKISQLSYVECIGCKNYFFIHELDNVENVNDPRYCPYCGVEFDYEVS